MTNDFDTALTAFVAVAQTLVNKNYEHYKNLTAPRVYADPGGIKNVRVVIEGSGSRSVFCFVRKVDGAILKAAGWKAPAKHARGSIYVNNGVDAITAYGARYIR